MKTERISTEPMLALLELMNKALVAQPRQEKIASLLLYNEEKIYYFIDSLFNKIVPFNYFDQRIFSAKRTYGDITFSEIPLDAKLTPKTALNISYVFLMALSQKMCCPGNTEKLLSDEKNIYKMIDQLFEIRPAFNIYEYRQFINHAPLDNFREVQDFNGNDFIVCTADEVCEPWGHKSGDRVRNPNCVGDEMTIIGVAPFLEKGDLALWTADDSLRYKNPDKCIVGAWRTPEKF